LVVVVCVQSVVQVPAYALAIEEAAKKGDLVKMLRLGGALNQARVR
jgi:hypothetical protein